MLPPADSGKSTFALQQGQTALICFGEWEQKLAEFSAFAVVVHGAGSGDTQAWSGDVQTPPAALYVCGEAPQHLPQFDPLPDHFIRPSTIGDWMQGGNLSGDQSRLIYLGLLRSRFLGRWLASDAQQVTQTLDRLAKEEASPDEKLYLADLAAARGSAQAMEMLLDACRDDNEGWDTAGAIESICRLMTRKETSLPLRRCKCWWTR